MSDRRYPCLKAGGIPSNNNVSQQHRKATRNHRTRQISNNDSQDRRHNTVSLSDIEQGGNSYDNDDDSVEIIHVPGNDYNNIAPHPSIEDKMTIRSGSGAALYISITALVITLVVCVILFVHIVQVHDTSLREVVFKNSHTQTSKTQHHGSSSSWGMAIKQPTSSLLSKSKQENTQQTSLLSNLSPSAEYDVYYYEFSLEQFNDDEEKRDFRKYPSNGAIPGLLYQNVMSYRLCCNGLDGMFVCASGESITVDHILECMLRKEESEMDVENEKTQDSASAFLLVYASPITFSNAKCFFSWHQQPTMLKNTDLENQPTLEK